MLILPFLGIGGMIYYCGTEFLHGLQCLYYGVYGVIAALLVWVGLPLLWAIRRWIAGSPDTSGTKDGTRRSGSDLVWSRQTTRSSRRRHRCSIRSVSIMSARSPGLVFFRPSPAT